MGSGGREHALAWKLRRSPTCDELHAAPGNPGIARVGACHPVRAEDAEGLLALCRGLGIDLVVVGPERPLVDGLADELRAGGVSVFGPTRAAARIEGSKAFAKDLMREAGVPTAQAAELAAPCVIKIDGLAAGKGVFVCHGHEDVARALSRAEAIGGELVVEELLEGEELSVFAVTDGRTVVPLGAAQDFKRAGDGDEGPNTGGMGAYAPVASVGPDELEELVDLVHRPVVEALARRRAPFTGLLYAGLMLTEDGPRVLEFNCRFGDPETEAVLPLLEGDLLGLLAAAAAGDLEGATAPRLDGAAVTVVVAADGYPRRGDAGTPIDGVDDAEADGATVFHAGTALRDGRLVTNGGRILAVTGTAPELPEARRRSYDAVGRISIAGSRYRTDIALKACGLERVAG